MEEDKFGTVMYNGKIVNVDTEDIEILKRISKELKEKNEELEKKSEKIFNQ